jgi:dihydrolipoamide dehydrogenase
MPDPFDLIVIGAGPGGYTAAIRAAQLGLKVALIEKTRVGGTCLNIGCIPSKALLDSSELFLQAKKSLGRHGIQISAVGLDLPKMMQRKLEVVKGLTDGLAFVLGKNKIQVIIGTGRLTSASTVVVKPSDGKPEQTLQAKAILLATGSDPIELPFLKFDGQYIGSSTDGLSYDKVPEHLIVVGAGYIGLELGSVWSRLGSKVTVVEALPAILPFMDREIAEALKRSLTRQGLVFQTDTKVTGATIKGGKVTLKAEQAGKPVEFVGDRVLVAVGRRAYTDGLGLETVGLALDGKTRKMVVDENFQTAVKGVYAIGDLIDGPMLAHKAEDDGTAFAERLVGHKTKVHYDTVPAVIYTWPEVASVGLTEEQLKERGINYRVGKFPFTANGRAKAMDESEGMVKVLADAKTDRVLGVHIFGPRASDMIAEAVTIMEFSGSSEDIARICHAHPTLSEAVREAALAVDRRAINLPPPT